MRAPAGLVPETDPKEARVKAKAKGNQRVSPTTTDNEDQASLDKRRAGLGTLGGAIHRGPKLI